MDPQDSRQLLNPLWLGIGWHCLQRYDQSKDTDLLSFHYVGGYVKTVLGNGRLQPAATSVITGRKGCSRPFQGNTYSRRNESGLFSKLCLSQQILMPYH